MMKKAILILPVAAFLLTSVVWAVYESWPFRIAITIDNTSSPATAYTNLWVRIDDFPASDLIGGNFMLSDAGDVRLVDPTGTDLLLFAQDLDQDDATWWFKAPSISTSPSTYYMHLGRAGQTREQALGLTSTDSVAVADDGTLDITTRLTTESLDTVLDTIPSAETWLLNKNQAYGLGVRSGNEVFAYITPDTVAAASEDFLPTGRDTTAIGNEVGCAAGSHWQCVDDPVGAPDDLATYIWSGNVAEEKDFYDIGTPSVIDDQAYIDHIDLTGRNEVTGGGQCESDFYLKLAGVETTTSGVNNGGGWLDTVRTVARPGGGGWLVSDLDSLKIGIGLAHSTGGGECRLTQFYATVFYINPTEAVFSPIVVDTEYDFRATYDGTNLRLYVDDALEDTVATAITVNSTATTVDIGPFSGEVSRTRGYGIASAYGAATFDDVAGVRNCITVAANDMSAQANGIDVLGGAGFSLASASKSLCNITDNAAIQDKFAGGGSVELWMKPHSLGEASQGSPVGKGHRGGGTGGWAVTIESAATDYDLYFWVDTIGAGSARWRVDDAGFFDTWIHVAITYDSDSDTNDPIIYLNGVSQTIVEEVGPSGAYDTDVGNAIAVGDDFGGGNAFDGAVDELRYWDDVRTASEILANYQSVLTGSEADLLVYHDFESFTDGSSFTRLDLQYEPLHVDETAQGIATATGILTGDANSGQADVAVPDGTLFAVQQTVSISDDTPDTESNTIASIVANTLTMTANLANNYTTAQNAQVVGTDWEWRGTITDQSLDTNDGVYTFVRDMADLASIKGPLEIKKVNVGEFPLPTPISVVQTPLDTTFTSTNNGASFPILGPFITAGAGVMGLSANLVWLMVLIALSILALVVVLQRVKEPMSAMVAAGLVLSLGPMISVYSWFIVIAYILVATSISVVVIRR